MQDESLNECSSPFARACDVWLVCKLGMNEVHALVCMSAGALSPRGCAI